MLLTIASDGRAHDAAFKDAGGATSSTPQPKGMNMFNQKTLVVLIAAAAGLVGSVSSVQAGEWKENHPRRVEVNRHLENQNDRIHREVREGEMSRGEARSLHYDDRQIRQEERDMASQDGGHITKTEQRVVNQQENQVSRKIGG